MQVRVTVAIACLVAMVGTAGAQPGDPPVPEAPMEIRKPPPPPEPPVVTADSTAVKAAYDKAFALLVSEQWEAAARAFAEVAAQSVEPERRGAAAELGRFAKEMDERGESGPKRSSGRASFVATTTLASFYAGFVLDDLLAVEDYKAQTLVVTGATLGGFTAALLASKGRKITDSMASAYGSGLLVGAGNGLFLAPFLGIDPDGGPGDGEVNQAYLGFGLLTMAAGGASAMYLADVYDPTAAQAQFAGLMGVNGLITMGLGLVMVQPDIDGENILALLAVGLDAGVVVGVTLGRDLTWSRSRLTYVSLAEFLGGLTGVAAAVVTVDDGSGDSAEQLGAALVLAGVWGGFAIAYNLTSDMAPDPRYRQQAPAVTVVPTVMDHGGRGLAIAGAF